MPKAVKIGHLNFRVHEFIPKPMRCYKCNCFGHVAKNCRGKDMSSKCSRDHSLQHCTSATTQCPTAMASTRLVTSNVPNIVGNQKFSKLQITLPISGLQITLPISNCLQITLPISNCCPSTNHIYSPLKRISTTACCPRGKPYRI